MFAKKKGTYQPPPQDPCNPKMETCIHTMKCKLDQRLPRIYKVKNYKPHKKQREPSEKFKTLRTEVTIKPSDKNLGIVLMNTDDYVLQCVSHPVPFHLTNRMFTNSIHRNAQTRTTDAL